MRYNPRAGNVLHQKLNLIGPASQAEGHLRFQYLRRSRAVTGAATPQAAELALAGERGDSRAPSSSRSQNPLAPQSRAIPTACALAGRHLRRTAAAAAEVLAAGVVVPTAAAATGAVVPTIGARVAAAATFAFGSAVTSDSHTLAASTAAAAAAAASAAAAA
eukprot:CAMPEP_0170208476 /NCGR_PEP_ID=MMETSP0116_2-20130129/3824_1 /TAXON_ID=400756 /ORGANISM="Durinskia baltica, Strain CSIRO CS-38" /LENGTH=161 /DNA_ID=CAMNT_0010458951 /DNA_START=175 /DNA_END=657 /DNA_ORIENTATION=+